MTDTIDATTIPIEDTEYSVTTDLCECIVEDIHHVGLTGGRTRYVHGTEKCTEFIGVLSKGVEVVETVEATTEMFKSRTRISDYAFVLFDVKTSRGVYTLVFVKSDNSKVGVIVDFTSKTGTIVTLPME